MQKLQQRQDWQAALADAITDPAELLQILQLDSAFLVPAQKAAKLFGLRVPRGFVNRMQKNNPRDPLLRQILPLGEEAKELPDYIADPLGEASANPLPGLLHKYKSRVLLTVVGGCSINCRYCFRREFPYGDNNPGRAGWENVIDYIEQHKEVREVILSGGDPLIANDLTLKSLSEKLCRISHVKTLRIHSRVPIVLPERITSDFLAWLKALPLRKVLVLHCNHPRELTPSVYEKLAALSHVGVRLLNQSVLLQGVNDDANTLIELSEVLFDAGVLPYYLHLLDKVRGTSHFNVSEERAKKLIQLIQAELPGYLVPRLAREIAGKKSKTLISIE